MIPARNRRRIEERLRRVEGGCLVWKTADPDGRHWYRTVTVNGRRFNLRRLLFALRRRLKTMPPPTVRLKTTCNNPACLNPAHMEEL